MAQNSCSFPWLPIVQSSHSNFCAQCSRLIAMDGNVLNRFVICWRHSFSDGMQFSLSLLFLFLFLFQHPTQLRNKRKKSLSEICVKSKFCALRFHDVFVLNYIFLLCFLIRLMSSFLTRHYDQNLPISFHDLLSSFPYQHHSLALLLCINALQRSG